MTTTTRAGRISLALGLLCGLTHGGCSGSGGGGGGGAVAAPVTSGTAPVGSGTAPVGSGTPAGAAVTLAGVSPERGAPGSLVTLTGSGFLAGCTVELGGAAASDVALLSESALRCRVPNLGDGPVDVKVVTPAGAVATLAQAYQVIEPLRGVPDTTFGQGGVVRLDDPAGAAPRVERANACTIDPQGRIVVVGAVASQAQSLEDRFLDLAVWRFLADGTPDTTFGQGGRVLSPVSADQSDEGRAVFVDGAGRIVVVGQSTRITTSTTNGQTVQVIGPALFVRRFSDAGVRDSGYGLVVTSEFTFVGQAVLDDQERVVVLTDGGAVARYAGGAALDATFGTNGFVRGLGDVRGVSVDGQGRYLLVGVRFPSSGTVRRLCLTRLLPSGAPDPGLGQGAGRVEHEASAFGLTGIFLTSAPGAVDADGRQWVSCRQSNGLRALVRLSEDGALVPFPGGSNAAPALVAHGRLLSDARRRRLLVWEGSVVHQLDLDGALDPQFASLGTLALGAGGGQARAAVLDAQGRLVLAGATSGTNDADVTVWRFR